MGWTTEGILVQFLSDHTGYGPTHPLANGYWCPFARSTVVISHLRTVPTLSMRADKAPVPYTHFLFDLSRVQVRVCYTNS
jgi:hypothetical protein